MKKYITEFSGTLFLVILIGYSLAVRPDLAFLSIGLGLSVLVYAGYGLSGAHYNPAVTLAMLWRRKIDRETAVVYMMCQLAGAVAGNALLKLTGDSFHLQPDPASNVFGVLGVEMAFTGLLVWVIQLVATSPKTRGNRYYGLAIGSSIGLGIFLGGSVSGGAFNPAVGLGPLLLELEHVSLLHCWYYIIGPVAGGYLAVLSYRWIFPRE